MGPWPLLNFFTHAPKDENVTLIGAKGVVANQPDLLSQAIQGLDCTPDWLGNPVTGRKMPSSRPLQ